MSYEPCKAQRVGNTPYLEEQRDLGIRARAHNSMQGCIFLHRVQVSIILGVRAGNFGGSVGLGTEPLVTHTCTDQQYLRTAAVFFNFRCSCESGGMTSAQYL